MGDRYIYGVAVEAFFLRAMAGKLEGDVRLRLRDAGIAIDEPLLSVYPAAVFHRAVAIASRAAYPEVEEDEALRLAGRDHIDAFAQTYPGKMMAALARQIPPRTILEYTATFIRLGNNFTESRVHPVAPTRVHLWLNDVGGVPAWYHGIIERGLEIAGLKEIEVARVDGTEPPAATYAVGWGGR